MKAKSDSNSTPAIERPRQFSKARPLAQRVGTHPRTLFRWADAGKIHRHKVSARLVVFDVEEVMAFIEAARVAPAANGAEGA